MAVVLVVPASLWRPWSPPGLTAPFGHDTSWAAPSPSKKARVGWWGTASLAAGQPCPPLSPLGCPEVGSPRISAPRWFLMAAKGR